MRPKLQGGGPVIVRYVDERDDEGQPARGVIGVPDLNVNEPLVM